MERKISISFSIELSKIEKLEKLAGDNRLTRSQLIANIVSDYLKKQKK